MGAPTSEVGYTSATTMRGDHEVYMDMRWHWGEGGVFQVILPEYFASFVLLANSVFIAKDP
jgi:hypothetical protein